MMKQYWEILSAKIDAMSTRERVLVFVTIVILALSLINTLLLEPQFARQKSLRNQLEQQQQQMNDVQSQIANLLQENSPNSNSPQRTQLNQYKQEIAEGNAFLKSNRDNLVQPEKDQLYVGWTKPGEWTKYTVNVTEAGTYQVSLMYTSNKNGKISIAVNDADITGEILVPSTFVEADSVAWRQWHHWNYLSNMASVNLKKGLQTITLHTADVGDMNYDYINFELVKQ